MRMDKHVLKFVPTDFNFLGHDRLEIWIHKLNQDSSYLNDHSFR